MEDKFKEMWVQQIEFIKLLQEKRGFPSCPVDIKTKQGQNFLKGLTHECMHELFEANQCLKNGKDHRVTDVKDFNYDDYIVELVDSFHYLLEIAIMSGVSLDEFYNSYMKKGIVNIKRINEGY